MGASFHGALLRNLGGGSYAGSLCVEEGSGTGVFPCGGPVWETLEEVRLPGTLRDGWRGSRDGTSLSEEAHCGGPRGRAPILGTLGYERKALGTGISLHGDWVGKPGVGSPNGDFERLLKWALELGRFSLWELCEGNLEGLWEMDEGALGRERFSLKRLSAEGLRGGLLYWGPWKIC